MNGVIKKHLCNLTKIAKRQIEISISNTMACGVRHREEKNS
jgi:hypothetical protein